MQTRTMGVSTRIVCKPQTESQNKRKDLSSPGTHLGGSGSRNHHSGGWRVAGGGWEAGGKWQWTPGDMTVVEWRASDDLPPFSLRLCVQAVSLSAALDSWSVSV